MYGVAPHIGRGGWTWYTGSASWMYRLLTETLLGVNREGGQLSIVPKMPRAWSSYKVHYRHLQTVYHITISRLPADSENAAQLILDGTELHSETLPLQDDQREHSVEYRYR